MIPVPLSDWGLTSSPCVLGTPPAMTVDPRCGSAAAAGAVCAASSFPYLGTTDQTGTCQPASAAMGFGVLLLIALGLYATFQGGN